MSSNQISIHIRNIDYELPEGLVGNFKLVPGIRDPDLISTTDYAIFIVRDNNDLLTYINALAENPNTYIIIDPNVAARQFDRTTHQNLIEDDEGKVIDIQNEDVYVIKGQSLRYAIVNVDRVTIIRQEQFDDPKYMKKLLQNLIKKIQRSNVAIYDTSNPIPKPSNYVDPIKSDIISSQRVNINALAAQLSADKGNNNNNNNFDYERINPYQDIPQMGGVAPINPANLNPIGAIDNLALALPNVVRNKWVLLGITSSVIVGGLVYLLYKNPIFGKSIESKIPSVTEEFINKPEVESNLPASGKLMSELFIEHLKNSDTFSDDEKMVLNPALDNITIEENLTPGDTNITPDYLVPTLVEPDEQVHLNVYEPIFKDGDELYGPENMPLYGPENMPSYGREISTYVIDIGKTYNKDIAQGIIPQTLNVEMESLDISKKMEQYESNPYLLYIGAGAILLGILYKFVSK